MMKIILEDSRSQGGGFIDISPPVQTICKWLCSTLETISLIACVCDQ